jgi:hypothetical protein
MVLNIVTAGYDYINAKTAEIDTQATQDAIIDGVEAARTAALSAAIAANNAAAAASGAQTTATQNIDGIAEISSILKRLANVLTGSYNSFESWQDLRDGTPTQGLSYLKVALDDIHAAQSSASAAWNRVIELQTMLQAWAEGAIRYPANNAGKAAYEVDVLAGKITGSGPILMRVENAANGDEGIPTPNPLYYMYVGADGNVYPITAGLMADVLNTINIYPRP